MVALTMTFGYSEAVDRIGRLEAEVAALHTELEAVRAAVTRVAEERQQAREEWEPERVAAHGTSPRATSPPADPRKRVCARCGKAVSRNQWARHDRRCAKRSRLGRIDRASCSDEPRLRHRSGRRGSSRARA
jgi:hypothetical protein